MRPLSMSEARTTLILLDICHANANIGSGMASYQIIDPCRYPDWNKLLSSRDETTIFHTSHWARAIIETYGFEPLYLLGLKEGRLEALIPLMEVHTPFNGKRGVSLPFTDHCPVIAQDPKALSEGIRMALEVGRARGWGYLELRDGHTGMSQIRPWNTYVLHEIDLGKSDTELFRDLTGSNRRNIRTAGRHSLHIVFERSWRSLQVFYRLHCITRRRHGLPPQSLRFFMNVHKYIFQDDLGMTATAYRGGQPIASAIFFYFGTRAVFKYGASMKDETALRPNNLLIWDSIRWFKRNGFRWLDLGRSDQENVGLLRFKRGWGGSERLLDYQRYDMRGMSLVPKGPKHASAVRRIMKHAPIPVLRAIGTVFYREAA